MADYLGRILDYVKNMAFFNQKHKERIIVNVNEDLERQIKEICQIKTEEKIVIVLDDSQWNNLQEIVVFTDNNIYWHIKDAYMKIKEENTEITVKGYGLINNKELNTVSVFSKKIDKIKYIYIISSSLQIKLPIKNIEIEHSLALTFYEYISRHSGGYKPKTIENENIFKIISSKDYYSNDKYKEMSIKNKKLSIFKIIFNLIGIVIIFLVIFFLIGIGALDLNRLYNFFERLLS
jgi:hypothetical protein